MKKFKFFAFLAMLIISTIVFVSCSMISVPKNVKLDGNILSWDYDDSVTEYDIKFSKGAIITTSFSTSFSPTFTDDSKERVQVDLSNFVGMGFGGITIQSGATYKVSICAKRITSNTSSESWTGGINWTA